MLGNFSCFCCRPPAFFKITFQEHYQSVKIFAKVIRRQRLVLAMRGSKKFHQRGPNSDNFFLMRRENIQIDNCNLNGPSSARQRNVIQLAFRWRADDDPTLNAVLVAL